MSFVEKLRHIRESILSGSFTSDTTKMPWTLRLHNIANAAKLDPWECRLRKYRGKIGKDGVERVSTSELFDALEVPEGLRTRGAVRLSEVMEKLGWSRTRLYRLNSAGYA